MAVPVVGIAVDPRAVGLCLQDSAGDVAEACTVTAPLLAGSHTGGRRDDPAHLADLAVRAVEVLTAVLADHAVVPGGVRCVVGLPLPGLARARAADRTGGGKRARRAAASTAHAAISDQQRAIIAGAVLAALAARGLFAVVIEPQPVDPATAPEVLRGSRPMAWVRHARDRHPRGGTRFLEQEAWGIAKSQSGTPCVSPAGGGLPTTRPIIPAAPVVPAPSYTGDPTVDGRKYRDALMSHIAATAGGTVVSPERVLAATTAAIAAVPRPAGLPVATPQQVADRYRLTVEMATAGAAF